MVYLTSKEYMAKNTSIILGEHCCQNITWKNGFEIKIKNSI